MSDLPDDWKLFIARLEREREPATREREASARRADKLRDSLDGLTDLMAKQGQGLTDIRETLRRREEQRRSRRARQRKLRRLLGLDDHGPYSDVVPSAPTAVVRSRRGRASGRDVDGARCRPEDVTAMRPQRDRPRSR